MLTMAEELANGLAEIRQSSTFTFIYHRGIEEIELTNVVKGTKKWRFTDDNLLSQHVETKDLIFDVSQFTGFKRGSVEPLAGELVSQQVNPTQLDWFQVVSVNKERVWHFSDPQETTIRLHTLFLRRETIA